MALGLLRHFGLLSFGSHDLALFNSRALDRAIFVANTPGRQAG
jgi:hypothetical protein